MHFFYFFFSTYIFCAQETSVKQIESWLLETHNEIIAVCDTLESRLFNDAEEKNRLNPLINHIQLFRERESNENNIALTILNNHEHKNINLCINSKINSLKCVKKQYSCFKEELPCCELCFCDAFPDYLKKCELFEMFENCINNYNGNNCYLFRPGLKDEDRILKDLELVVSKQIERIQTLERKLSDLKNQETTSETNPSLTKNNADTNI